MSSGSSDVNVILHRLDGLDKSIEEMKTENRAIQRETQEALNEIRPRLAVLEWKSGMWGAIAGAVMVIGALLMQFL